MAFGRLIVLFIWIATLAVVLVLFRKDIRRYPGAQFVFGITDIWAFALCLSPLLMVVAYMINNREAEVPLAVALIGIPHGLGGAYMAVLKNSIAREGPERARWRLFLTTLPGTFVGTTLFPAFTLLILLFFGFILAAFVMALPWSLIATIAVFALSGYFRRKRVEASDAHPNSPQDPDTPPKN